MDVQKKVLENFLNKKRKILLQLSQLILYNERVDESHWGEPQENPANINDLSREIKSLEK